MGKSDIFNKLPESLQDYIIRNNKFPTLFSKIKRGKVEKERYWDISVIEDDQGTIYIRTEYGDVGTNKPIVSTEVVNSGKNLGKSSATNPLEQAILQAKSKFADKFAACYISDELQNELDIDISDTKVFPMLANKYEEGNKNLKFPAGGSAKIDGLRCLAHVSDGEVMLYSKSMEHISGQTAIRVEILDFYNMFYANYPNLYFDGEIYDEDREFDEINGAVRTKKREAVPLKYYMFDIFDVDRITSWKFLDRYREMKSNLAGKSYEWIKLVKVVTVNNFAEIELAYKDFLSKKFEGIILRNLDGLYKLSNGKSGRSQDLFKMKPVEHDKVTIKDITIDTKKDTHPVIFSVIMESGVTFNLTASTGKHEYREEVYNLRSSYIGKKIWIEYYELKKGVPKHAHPLLNSEGKYSFE